MLRVFSLSFVCLLMMQTLAAQDKGIQFLHEWDEALKEAKAQNKLIFVDAFTTWCGPCRRMASETFTKDDVGNYFNSNFVNAKLDMEKGTGPDFSRKYTITAYPTILFIDGDGKVVHRTMGYQTPEQLMAFAKAALKMNDKSGEFRTLYEKGDRSPDMLRKYAYALMQSGQDYIKIVNEYILQQKDFSAPEDVDFLFDFANYVDSKVFDMMMKNRDAVVKRKGEDAFRAKVKTACENTSKRAIEFQNEDLLNQSKATAKKNKIADCEQFCLQADLDYYLSTGNEAKYMKAAGKFAKIYKSDETKLYAISRSVLTHMKGASALKKGESWAAAAYKGMKKYDHAHNYADYLFRAGKMDKALTVAEDAIKLAEKENSIPIATRELIEKIKAKK